MFVSRIGFVCFYTAVRMTSKLIILKCYLQTANDVQPAIGRKKEKMAAMSLTVQPFVVIVGDLSEHVSSYVSIDSLTYKVSSTLKAVDICFKAIHVLHAEYPPESAQIWQLIQRAVYDLKTKWDRQFPRVGALLSFKH